MDLPHDVTPIDCNLMRKGGKGERTRAAILDQAMAMVSNDGLGAVSIGRLAAETGLSKSGLFAHFASKENLQFAVLDTAAEQLKQAVVSTLRRTPRGLPRLRALLDGWLQWSQRQPGGCPLVTVANELKNQHGPARDRLLAYHREWLSTLGRLATSAVDEGHFRPDVDTQQVAFELEAIMLSFHHFNHLLGDPEAESRVRRAFDRLIDLYRPA